METADKPKLRWFQYSLRTLLIFMTLMACGSGWLALKIQQAKKQHAAVAAFLRSHGELTYDYQYDAQGNFLPNAKPPALLWLRELTTVDLFSSVRTIRFFHAETHVDLELLAGMTQAESVLLSGPEVTDACVAHLRGMTQLKDLMLESAALTDAGLAQLKGLNQLTHLTIFFPPLGGRPRRTVAAGPLARDRSWRGVSPRNDPTPIVGYWLYACDRRRLGASEGHDPTRILGPCRHAGDRRRGGKAASIAAEVRNISLNTWKPNYLGP